MLGKIPGTQVMRSGLCACGALGWQTGAGQGSLRGLGRAAEAKDPRLPPFLLPPGVRSTYEGAQRLQGAAPGERGRDRGTEGGKKQHQGQ